MQQVRPSSIQGAPDMVHAGPSPYFDFQAAAGVTKHIGGASATDDLTSLCRLQPGQGVLDVGCGVGFTARYLAQSVRLHVVGVDLRAGMVERAREYSANVPVDIRPEFRLADAQSLPFEDNRFDAVICESVLAFVPNRALALAEFIRVTKPGGWVGFTEAFWAKQPSPDMERVFQRLEPSLRFEPSSTWEALLAHSHLTDTVVHINAGTNAMKDARNQLRRMGMGTLLRSWWRSLALLRVTRFRSVLFGAGKLAGKHMNSLGYGVYVGRKPA
ncbi:MAG: class I SAM-dependent methyltransferase [Anaerolineae bacterium]